MTNAERQRRYRERKRNGERVVTGVVKPEGVTVTRPVTRRVKRCLNCEVLAGEVAALKRQLAGRHPIALEAEIATRALGLKSLDSPCIHGAVWGRCEKIGCRPA